ncbi:MAG: hypothetical protein HFE76_08170 [Firmicutes bacterium]|nr:hypothetical protein [Bacillota bacterium]
MATKKTNQSGRLWWLQLQFAFFSDKKVRALRRKYGDLALIIYQKMMLKSLGNDCYMKFEGLEDTFEEEIAVDIIEDEAEKVELIKNIMGFLIKHELMINQGKQARDKSSQCDKEQSQTTDVCDDNELHNDDIITETNTDIHLKSNNNKTLDGISKTETEQADAVSVDRQTASAAAEAEPSAGELFSVEQLSEIVQRNKVNLSQEGVKNFYDEMQESGWILYGKPVEKKGIVKALRGYAKYQPKLKQKQDSPFSSIMKKAKKEIPSELIKLYLKNHKNWLLLIPKYCDIELFTDMELQDYKKRFYIWKDKYEIEIGNSELPFKKGWDEYLKER